MEKVCFDDYTFRSDKSGIDAAQGYIQAQIEVAFEFGFTADGHDG